MGEEVNSFGPDNNRFLSNAIYIVNSYDIGVAASSVASSGLSIAQSGYVEVKAGLADRKSVGVLVGESGNVYFGPSGNGQNQMWGPFASGTSITFAISSGVRMYAYAPIGTDIRVLELR